MMWNGWTMCSHFWWDIFQMILEKTIKLMWVVAIWENHSYTTSVVGGWLAKTNNKGIDYEDKQERDKKIYVDEIM
jgi:hypothetical protein